MTEERRDPRELAPEDADFVGRLAKVYAPRPSTSQERVAFRADLDRRLERERRKPWLPALGGLAAAGLALALALGPTGSRTGSEAGPERPAPGASLAGPTPEEALLALATVSAGPDEEEGADEDLPDDYEAIASLFLGEV